MTIQAVREDLNEIRYYFARKKQLDDASIVIGNNKVVDMINRYHCATSLDIIDIIRFCFGSFGINQMSTKL